jgi:hypothetical protein
MVQANWQEYAAHLEKIPRAFVTDPSRLRMRGARTWNIEP